MGDISASIGNTGLKALLFSKVHENLLLSTIFGGFRSQVASILGFPKLHRLFRRRSLFDDTVPPQPQLIVWEKE